MRWIAGLLLVALVCAKEPSKPENQAKRLRVPVTVNAEDRVSAADFSATAIGIGNLRVARVLSPDDDLLLITVLDLVGDLAYVDSARRSFIDQAQQLPAKTHIGLMRAQDGLQVLIDPTADREAIANAVLSMPVNGKAGLLDTVELVSKVAEAVGNKSPVRVAILYITDSDVRNYREDFTNPVINSSDSRDLSRRFPEGLIRERISRLEDAVAGFQTPIFVLHIAYSRERLNEAYQSGLLQLATSTGGSATFCRSSGEIAGEMANIVARIAGQYQVHLQLPAKAPKSLNLTLSCGERTLDYRTRFTLR